MGLSLLQGGSRSKGVPFPSRMKGCAPIERGVPEGARERLGPWKVGCKERNGGGPCRRGKSSNQRRWLPRVQPWEPPPRPLFALAQGPE